GPLARQRRAECVAHLVQHRLPAGVVGARALGARSITRRLLGRAVGLQVAPGFVERRQSARFDVAGRLIVFPRVEQLPEALLQTRRVGAAAIEHALQTLLLARARPVAPAALQAARQPLDQRCPWHTLAGADCAGAVEGALQIVVAALAQQADDLVARLG